MSGQIVNELHHLQLAMPAGKEAEARTFYAGVLDFEEVPKPEHLRKRGGCWFRSGSVEFHLGVDPDFRSAKKAHPAFVVDSLKEVTNRLRNAGHEITQDTQIFGYERVYSSDPFGNRVEFLSKL